MKDQSIKRYYTLQEAAVYLALTESALRTMVARRQIDFQKLGSRIRFDINDLENMMIRYSSVNSIK
ncbi:MAG: helix-turn-helix domain-containing protein [Candidatus Marinimicrobia bacterium]|nr:helix-turn-helix domain-containing protein [Candidatus Neomarinimicrobiota bacterium]